MDEDEQREKRIKSYQIGQETADLSVDEIAETIEALRAEITRLEEIRNQKSAHLEAAASLFKTN